MGTMIEATARAVRTWDQVHEVRHKLNLIIIL